MIKKSYVFKKDLNENSRSFSWYEIFMTFLMSKLIKINLVIWNFVFVDMILNLSVFRQIIN